MPNGRRYRFLTCEYVLFLTFLRVLRVLRVLRGEYFFGLIDFSLNQEKCNE